MKQFLTGLSLIFFVLLYSCSEKNSGGEGSDSHTITYSIDTVMVDPKDHIFFVNYSLFMFDVDTDKRIFYNYNPEKSEIEQIDLEGLKLKQVDAYEKEGPNGVGGAYTMGINLTDDGDIIFYNYQEMVKVNSEGEKITAFKLQKDNYEGDELPEDMDLNSKGILSKDGRQLVGFFGKQSLEGKIEGLLLLDLENKTRRVIPSDFLKFTNDFDVTIEINGGGGRYGEQNVPFLHDSDQIIITSSAKNEIWRYDLKKDTLTSRTYESKLTSNVKKGNYPSRVSSMEEFERARNEKGKEVNFGRLIPDVDQQIFWRFTTEMDKVIGQDSVVFKTVLTAFDEELNQLAEQQLPKEYKSTYSMFFMDGMIWQFLNIDDEVAFTRLKVELHEK